MDGDDCSGHWGEVRMKTNRLNEYVYYMKNQIKKLIEDYDTDMMWFDGDWVYWWNMELGEDLYQYIRGLKPDIIINNRVAKRSVFKKDFGTPEQEHPEGTQQWNWEVCYTLNGSWGYKKDDHNWKDAHTVYDKFKDINNKGGNLLLNIGSDGNGNVLKKYCEYFNTVGEKCNETGLRFGYHNHSKKFTTEFEGTLVYGWMLELTDLKKVMFHLDLYWIAEGGKNALDYFGKYPGKFELWHIKDEAEIGVQIWYS